MWSYGDCLKFCITAFNHIPKIISGINIINGDTFKELSETFGAEYKDVSSGIDKTIIGVACNFWLNTVISLITLILTIGQFSGILGIILDVGSDILGIGIGLLINALIIMCMYNHQTRWSGIWLKIYMILVFINMVFSIFGIIGGIFSFSLIGILNLASNLISLLCYSLILQGILE